MASITCPKCGSLLDTPPEKAGQKIVCPDCGNVTVAPAAGAAPPGAPPVAGGPAESPLIPSADEKQERTWAALVHLAGLAFFVPFGNVLGPLVIWLVLRDKHPAVDRHGKAAINFQFSVLIYLMISMVLVVAFGLGILLGMVVIVLDLIFVITATMRASEGQYYSYPISFHFLK